MIKAHLSLTTLVLASLLCAGSAAASGTASHVGDIVYKKTGLTSFFTGHVGVLFQEGTTRQVADVTNGRGEHAIGTTRAISGFEDSDGWGARRFTNQKYTGLSSAQKVSMKARITYYSSSNVEYDDNHLDQKGTWFQHNHWWEGPSHWEFDCVGFVERIMEDIGLNPTSNSYESGSGWPLTPSEQHDSSLLTPAPGALYRTTYDCATRAAIGPETKIDLTDGSYSNFTCTDRYQAQCIDDGSFDQYYVERCPD